MREIGIAFEETFNVEAEVGPPIVIGQGSGVGRRQLVPILSGKVTGPGGVKGVILPGGVDSQIIRPDGRCELSARYGIRMEDGASIYIENNGIRTVPPEYAEDVLAGRFVDPGLYYFRTVPRFETYSETYRWLCNFIFVCSALRLPDSVLLKYYRCA